MGGKFVVPSEAGGVLSATRNSKSQVSAKRSFMDSAAAAFTSGAASHELDFASALQAAEAIRKKGVS